METWKRRRGAKERTWLERHKERSVFAGLCNCADLIGGERKTISLSRSSALRKGKGGERKRGDVRWRKRVKQCALLAACLRVYKCTRCAEKQSDKEATKDSNEKKRGCD